MPSQEEGMEGFKQEPLLEDNYDASVSDGGWWGDGFDPTTNSFTTCTLDIRQT